MFFGENIGSQINDGSPIKVVSGVDYLDLKVLEQLCFRLTNLEAEVTVYLVGMKLTENSYYKYEEPYITGNDDKDDTIRKLINQFPNITFGIETARDFKSKAYDNHSHVIVLNQKDASKWFTQWNTLHPNRNNYTLNYTSEEQKRVYIINWGLTDDNKVAVAYKFNYWNGLLTHTDLDDLGKIKTVKQLQEIRFLVSLLVNQLLMGVRMTYSGIVYDSGMEKEILVIPNITYLQKLGVIDDNELITGLNTIMDQVDQEELEDINKQELIRVVVLISESYIDISDRYTDLLEKETINIIRTVKNYIESNVVDSDVMYRWYKVLRELYFEKTEQIIKLEERVINSQHRPINF